jgi:hypothetical protein
MEMFQKKGLKILIYTLLPLKTLLQTLKIPKSVAKAR